ncbi:hypothetical protein ATCC90586_000067 [Pythium insidiosum]|nr:hypothetical protein ATCC90586_000067 [Pythium insidiosum]
MAALTSTSSSPSTSPTKRTAILVGCDAAKLHRARQQLLQDGASSVLTWTADLQDAKQVDALTTKIQQLDDDVHVQHLVICRGGRKANMAAAAPENEQPAGFLDRVSPYLRFVLMWYAFQSLTGSLSGRPAPSPAPSPSPSLDGLVDPATHAPTPAQAEPGQAPAFHNAFSPGDAMSLRLYLTQNESFSFSAMDATAEQAALLWHVRDVPYTTDDPREWSAALNVSVDAEALLQRNETLFAHVFVTKQGHSPNPDDAEYSASASMHGVTPLVAYRPRGQRVVKRNLLSASEPDEQPVAPEPVDDGTYEPLWKPSLTVNVVFDTTVYSRATVRPPPFLAPHMQLDHESSSYAPVLHLNEFWLLEEHLVPLNASSVAAPLPLKLSFYALPLYKFALYTQMAQNFANQEATGATTRRDTDNMKRMFLDTNPWLLGLTMVVSLLHSLFDFLAFKNDVSFWKQQKSLAGLSLRTLALNTFFQLVIFLYLMDNDTSWMVLLSSFVSLLINAWKIKKAVVIGRDPTTNRLTITGIEESYSESPTAEHDRVAVAHLSYVLYPLIVGHAAYSLAFGEHKGWYSYVLSSLTSFVYLFGFIMMTPQLYINYKLKSVAHLPWRAMVYKSLNTFIDDLFAFVIKMPWMHRLSCFRDDLIFFIYLYQRWIYPVDSSRTNEFGQGPAEEEQATQNASAGHTEALLQATDGISAAAETKDTAPETQATTHGEEEKEEEEKDADTGSHSTEYLYSRKK